MSKRTRVFLLAAAAIGLVNLASIAVHWHTAQPLRFGLYLAMAVICSCLRLSRQGVGTVFSLSLPFVLLSIVQLSLPEAVVVGCAAALVQCLLSKEMRTRPGQILLSVGMLATVIATAEFTWRSVLPVPLQSATLGLFVAAVALFFANTFPAAIAARFEDPRRLGQIWKESYFWSFPYYLVGAAVAGVIHMAGTGVPVETALLVMPIIYVAFRHYRVQKAQLEDQQRHAGDLAQLHLRAIEGLALAVEAKDNLNTRGHLRRVQVYALGLGRDLGLDARSLEALHAAALLHDIGKLAVPEHILTKPGKLTAEEFAKMKVHPVVGAEIVEQVRFPYPVAPIVRAHHEKWDGSGYPFGLKGEEIPLGGRILTAVDVLDALTSDREYRKAMPLEEVMALIDSESGKSFDPRVVAALWRNYRELDKEARAQAADQQAVLSTAVTVDKGKAPGAGLEMNAISGLAPGARPPSFLGSIAAAGRESQMLLEAAQGIGTSLNLRETLRQVERTLGLVVQSDAIAVFLRRANSLIVEHAAGLNHETLGCLEVPMGLGLVGWVAQNRSPIVNGSPAVDPGYADDPAARLASALAVPIEGASGTLGVLTLYRVRRDAFTRDELRILLEVTPKIGAAIENALTYAEARARANRDGLTDLPNAQMLVESFESELARARRQRKSVSALALKLAGQAELRRRHGAPLADQVLRSVAAGMKGSCREYDHVGRTGEDEFAMLMPGMKREHLASKLARLNEIAAEASRAVCGLELSFVGGDAIYPEDGDDARVLLSIAERRLTGEAQRQARDLVALNAAVGDSIPPAPLAVPEAARVSGRVRVQ